MDKQGTNPVIRRVLSAASLVALGYATGQLLADFASPLVQLAVALGALAVVVAHIRVDRRA